MAVVRIDAGKDAVRAYVSEHAGQGLAHILDLIRADNAAILTALDGLSEEEGTRVTLEGEWTPAQVMAHLNLTLPRSLARLQTLAAGREWHNPPVAAGQQPEAPASFDAIRQAYIDGMHGIIETLEAADETVGRDLIANHALFGDFNWLEWAVYSHHVHTSDHIGQLREARARVRGEA